MSVPGMSLRDYFAGQALVMFGPMLAPQIDAASRLNSADVISAHAYGVADAMLKAREANR